MKNVCIISEYNPLHTGHLRHLELVRRDYPDAVVCAIMSGNFVQRGEPAVLDKYTRARACIMSGFDLVLELPCPYSYASSEYFAAAGVHIAKKLGFCDILSFGSECGSIEKLEYMRALFASDEYLCAFEEAERDKSIGFLHAREAALRAIGKDTIAAQATRSNNILALEYLKALDGDSDIAAHTVRREGDDYNDICGRGEFVSASYLRKCVHDGVDISKFVPSAVADAFSLADIPSLDNISRVLLAKYRLGEAESFEKYAEVTHDLAYRLCDCAARAGTLDEFVSLAATKKYTNARIRRAILSCLLEYTEKDMKQKPSYTLLLGANKRGLSLLSSVRKLDGIPVITKHADTRKLDGAAYDAYKRAQSADALYTLCYNKALPSDHFLKAVPYIEK